MTADHDLARTGPNPRRLPTPSAAELTDRYGEPDDLANVSKASNEDRAWWARTAAIVYGDLEPGYEYQVDPEGVVVDLICNLLHATTEDGFDGEQAMKRAWAHFAAEVGHGYGDRP